MKNFHTKKLKEIKLWAWAATVLPITFLCVLFLVQFIGFEGGIQRILVIGGVIMFTLSVTWWWWALHTIGSVTYLLSETLKKFKKVNTELDILKEDIKDIKDTDDT